MFELETRIQESASGDLHFCVIASAFAGRPLREPLWYSVVIPQHLRGDHTRNDRDRMVNMHARQAMHTLWEKMKEVDTSVFADER